MGFDFGRAFTAVATGGASEVARVATSGASGLVGAAGSAVGLGSGVGDVFGSVLDPFGILGGGGGSSSSAPDTDSSSQSLDLEGYAAQIAAAQDNYTQTMRELTEMQVTESKKFATIQLAQSNINRAAMDDYKVAQNFVLRNIETGYIEQQTIFSAQSASFPMPFIDGHAVASSAPHVERPEMYDGNPDPLAAREAHMNRMDDIVAEVESGTELSQADKDYLAGLQPPVDWKDVGAIHHEADEAHQAYDAFKNARGPEPDSEAFHAWLDEYGSGNQELSQEVMDAYQTKENLQDIRDAAMQQPFIPLGTSLETISVNDPNNPGEKISAADYLTSLGYDPATMSLGDLDAAVEQAGTDFQDAQTALEDFVSNNPGPDFDSAGSQSLHGVGTSSVNLNTDDSEADLNTAEEIIAGLPS